MLPKQLLQLSSRNQLDLVYGSLLDRSCVETLICDGHFSQTSASKLSLIACSASSYLFDGIPSKVRLDRTLALNQLSLFTANSNNIDATIDLPPVAIPISCREAQGFAG